MYRNAHIKHYWLRQPHFEVAAEENILLFCATSMSRLRSLLKSLSLMEATMASPIHWTAAIDGTAASSFTVFADCLIAHRAWRRSAAACWR